MNVELNGALAFRRDNTIFIKLPRELWRDANGCCCAYCSEDGKDAPAFWDTLAVAADKPTSTWMVHMPELHGAQRKR
jgi:hypothetical protein